MAAITVRGLDRRVVARLKERAERHGRSLEAEARLILQEAADAFAAGVPAEVERVRERFPGRWFSDSADLIREDRQR